MGYVKCSSDGKLPTEKHFFPAASVCGFWCNWRWKYGTVVLMVHHVKTAFSQWGFQTRSHSVMGWLTYTHRHVFIRLQLFASSFIFISPTSSVLPTHANCKLLWGFLSLIYLISQTFPLRCLAQWSSKRRKPYVLWKMLFKTHCLKGVNYYKQMSDQKGFTFTARWQALFHRHSVVTLGEVMHSLANCPCFPL